MHNYYNLLLLIIFEFAIASTCPSLCCSCFSITVMYYITNFININFYCENSWGGGGEEIGFFLGGGGGGGYPRASPCMRPCLHINSMTERLDGSQYDSIRGECFVSFHHTVDRSIQ